MSQSNSTSSAGLVRALGPWMAVAVVVGTVIGSGVFKKPQAVAANVPDFGWACVVWVLGGVLALLGGLAFAEIAVLYPKAGGNYVFLREGYGRLAGFLWGWVEFWIIRGASLAALATVFSESLHDVLKNPHLQAALGLDLGPSPLGLWPLKALTVTVILVLALVNVRGVRWGGGLQFFITAVKVGSLLAITVLPFVAMALLWPVKPSVPPEFVGTLAADPSAPFPANLPWGSLGQIGVQSPPQSFDAVKFGVALLGVLWAYHGWMNIAPVAEEVKRPQRNIPLSLFVGIAIVIVVYLGANLAYALVIPQYEMAGMKETPVATQFCLRLLGPLGAAAASAAVMCSVFGALNGNLLVAPRLLYAMGEDRLAPAWLGAVHPRYHTPAAAILVMGGWSAAIVLGAGVLTTVGVLRPDRDHFNLLSDFAMFGAVSFETLAVATIFVFRWRRPEAERTYRCLGYPVVPAVYVLIMALVLVSIFVNQLAEALVGVGFIAVGALVYAVLFRGTSAPPPPAPGGDGLAGPGQALAEVQVRAKKEEGIQAKEGGAP